MSETRQDLRDRANETAADIATEAARLAHRDMLDGRPDSAGVRQEWGAFNSGQPVYDEEGEDITTGDLEVGLRDPESGEVTDYAKVDPQGVRNVLHERALAEDEARKAVAVENTEVANKPEVKRGILGRLAARFTNPKA